MSEDVSEKTPLILGQNPKNIRGVRPLEYQFGADTYEVFHNPKNPFLERILSSQRKQLQLPPEKTRALFQQLHKQATYRLSPPSESSPHKKRNVSNAVGSLSLSPTFNSPVRLRENRKRMRRLMKTFFQETLLRLRKDANSLSLILNEIIPLLVAQELKVRIYDAYRQFYSFEQFMQTLETLSQDTEVENFELFCSALFGFYSQFQ